MSPDSTLSNNTISGPGYQPGRHPPESDDGAHGRRRAHWCAQGRIARTETTDAVALPPIQGHEGHNLMRWYDVICAAETGSPSACDWFEDLNRPSRSFGAIRHPGPNGGYQQLFRENLTFCRFGLLASCTENNSLKGNDVSRCTYRLLCSYISKTCQRQVFA